jgi:hypothetical protein
MDRMTEGSEFEFGKAKNFLHVVQTGFEAHQASYPMSTGGLFPGGKTAGA